ncbi:hypothetical protein QTO34_012054 [Cnephaeus nilssonii]|uniref:Uncharacterized protein n=1 Tax=Cnephaeus nilssonii TaxID=3371016 RepID=A0AA40HC49_CNENI|nr:hypothetical protein QTO34_012054 [Eptesicus nilssonii]
MHRQPSSQALGVGLAQSPSAFARGAASSQEHQPRSTHRGWALTMRVIVGSPSVCGVTSGAIIRDLVLPCVRCQPPLTPSSLFPIRMYSFKRKRERETEVVRGTYQKKLQFGKPESLHLYGCLPYGKNSSNTAPVVGCGLAFLLKYHCSLTRNAFYKAMAALHSESFDGPGQGKFKTFSKGFTILGAIKNIYKSWEEVKIST